MLHSFYTGIENIFKRIGVELDKALPGGQSWHRELLDSMSAPSEFRSAIISQDLRFRLEEYLKFRHVFSAGLLFSIILGQVICIGSRL